MGGPFELLPPSTRADGVRVVVARRAGGATRPAARSLLRELLGIELGVAPESVPLRVSAHGKPFVDGPLRFSVSHSGELAVFAFANGREVGIDVERVRRVDARVPAETLAPPELAALATVPASIRDAAFLETWTRKEAYLKARGVGLGVSARAVVVSVLPGATPLLLGVDDAPGEAARWSLHRLALPPGHVGTLAIAAA